MRKITGLYTAMITPFDPKGEINEAGFKDNLSFQKDSRIDGIVLLGTTAEEISLTLDEKERLISIAVKQVGGSLSIMVGIGGGSTKETLHLASLAKQLGAHSLLAVTPYYCKPNQEGLFRYYQTLAESVDLPIVLYNNPGRTGVNLEPATVLRLAEIENIVGVKEASGNLSQINTLIDSLRDRYPNFSVFSGDDILTLPILALGGHGAVSVISNLVPEYVKTIVHAMKENRLAEARETHFRLMPLLRAFSVDSNPVPIKAAMTLCGFPAGECRPPLSPLNPSSEKIIKEALEKTNIAFSSKVY